MLVKWTAREPIKDRILVASFWALAPGVLASVPAQRWGEGSLVSRAFGAFLLALAATVLVGLTLWLFVTRAILTEGTLTLRAIRQKECLTVPFDSIVGYHMDKRGTWWVHARPPGTGCTHPAVRTRVAVREPWAIHRAFVAQAPKRLGGRRLRFPGTPPTEEFRGLWAFDVERYAGRWLPQLAGVLTAIFIGSLLTHRRNVGMLGQPLGILLILLVEMWGRLDVTNEGISFRAPFSSRTIRWADAEVIFREGPPNRRSFVIVGIHCAIHIPAHLASDLELMKKVLYSLPQPILCVNFDETTLRGFKQRKNSKETSAPKEELLPALTA